MSQPPDLTLEARLWAQGYRRVAGLDEVGRGAWAGPVVAAAVVFPPDQPGLLEALAGVRDSKMLTPQRRETLYPQIATCALAYAVGSASALEIDQVGIVPATRRAMMRALSSLRLSPDYLIVDAVRLTEVETPQYAIPKADLLHLSVSAASIIAKVYRDHWLVELDEEFPGYGMNRHKGYGTAAHLAALQQWGPCQQHRMSFAPLRRLISERHVEDPAREPGEYD